MHPGKKIIDIRKSREPIKARRLAIAGLFIVILAVAASGCYHVPNYGNNIGVDEAEIPERVQGEQPGNTTGFVKINLLASQLWASSRNGPNQTEASLVQPGREGFWHLMLPRDETEAWVGIVLAEPTPVSLLRVLPRAGQAAQMWHGTTAEFQGSDDGLEWTSLASLNILPWPPEEDWITFPIYEDTPYQYYRLYIWDLGYYAMARLELYTSP